MLRLSSAALGATSARTAATAAVTAGAAASASTAAYSTSLQNRMAELVPEERSRVAAFRKEHGNFVLGETTIGMAYGGMRGVPGLVTETSLLDAEEGIRFRGHSIPELQKSLPKAPGGDEPLPEGLFYLLLTGDVPTDAQAAEVTEEWNKRAGLPDHIVAMIDSFPKDLHPMNQLCAVTSALGGDSIFAKAYADGINKLDMWEPVLEDCHNLIAKLPEASARIYRNVFHDGVTPASPELDWSANYATMMGFDSEDVKELFRLYLTIHSDHEGGNVSAHATHLVGSALSDPYLSFTAGMAGLAGPLHGLANQEVLRFLTSLEESLGSLPVTDEQLTAEVWKILDSGRVIPGYGHAVLRKTDPRYMCQQEFALKHLPDDEHFKLVKQLYDLVPGILTEHGKTANPWPNVDAHSGVLLQHYGLTEDRYYTVMFGVSRALGVLASLTWDRALGLPIERPKSFDTATLMKKAGAA